MGDVVGNASVRRVGRPRQEGLTVRVLRAVIELVDADLPVTVAAVVARAGVSTAAIYRRWESVTDLLAEALNHGRAEFRGRSFESASAAVRALLPVDVAPEVSEPDEQYPVSRAKRRLRLGLEDPQLQKAYWELHAVRRRVVVAEAFRTGIRAGELRPDTDVDAVLDLIFGVYYYQFVVRGDSLDDPATRERCAYALDVVWRSISVAGVPLTRV